MPLVKPESLCVHILNVGDGDSIILEFPEVGGVRKYAVVDCYLAEKTIQYLEKLGADELEFVCATHPHLDHIAGVPDLLTAFKGKVRNFWDSGFRHTSLTHEQIIELIGEDDAIRFSRVTSGTERMCNGVKVIVLAPSIVLRNRYDTYGVNINNASIVLKLEYQAQNRKNPGVIVLGADAQFDSWSKIAEEFPRWEATANPDQKVKSDMADNPLNCQVLKVPHHGSKHGTILEFVEHMSPKYAVVSCSQTSSYGFPHEISLLALREEVDQVTFTDGTADAQRYGTTVIICNGSNRPKIVGLGDDTETVPDPPQ